MINDPVQGHDPRVNWGHFLALFALSKQHRTSEQNRTNGFFVLFDKDR